MKYAVVIEKTGNGYSAYVPDLPGCVAAADTRADTEQMIREAVGYHLEMLREHGEPVPEPQATTALSSRSKANASARHRCWRRRSLSTPERP